MRIIINGRFLLHRVTGVERYAREILQELDTISSPNEFVLAIPPGVNNVPEYKNIKIVSVGKLNNRMWEHISFPYYVHMNHAVSLNLCNVAPLLNPGIAVICDMKIKAYPQFFGRKFLLWYKLLFLNTTRRAKIIITISEFSKDEIIKYYNVSADKIVIIPCAWQHMNRVGYDEGALSKYGLIKNGYFFSMSSLDPNKNFKWVAAAAKAHKDIVFAVAGSINKDVFKRGIGFDVPNNMKLLGYVSDEEAKTLMRDCKAFLYPSFYEGFGMPPLEAIASGCNKIVVSDIPVMHEIFQGTEGITYVSCEDISSFAFDESTNSGCIKNVLEKYSWGNSATKLYELLRQI